MGSFVTIIKHLFNRKIIFFLSHETVIFGTNLLNEILKNTITFLNIFQGSLEIHFMIINAAFLSLNLSYFFSEKGKTFLANKKEKKLI